MNHLVPRTCTEVSQTDAERGVDKVSGQPLSQFRAASAYVLLGDPGSGKTTAFEVECDELGPEAERITARDFLWLDLDSHPEWRGRTLFIDGLDEVRAGSPDARTPFDQIRGRLDRLGRPPFRISCREADWLGSNDLKHLEAVSEDSQVKTLRLDPLRESDVGHILESRGYMDDVQGFIAEAKGMGLEGLLFNPQSLELLASAVVRQGDWPESRLETFERACAQMATEHNEEHIHGEQQLKPDRLIDVAGHLCAVQLISGAAGYSLNRREDNADYPGLDSCVYESPDILRRSLATKLFTVEADSRFAPVHRHIAEFLGARHVSRLIQDGLPAGRVVSLITGADGMVVTGLRGFSAWLASQCREARESLIERDPIGVGLYGDIRGFSVEEKDKLIGSLNREVAALGLSRDARSAFGPLANSDMESTLHDFLTDSRRAVDQQMVVEFLLHLLRWGEPLPNLSPALLQIVRDDTWWPRVKEAALDAFVHNCPDPRERTGILRELLADIQVGQISDPENELVGKLLTELYPREVTPSEIWDYLFEKGNPHLIGSYRMFWQSDILVHSSDQDVAVLLDGLYDRLSDLYSALQSHHLLDLPMKLLVRGLRIFGDESDPARIYNWLSVGTFRSWESGRSESIGPIRTWLEQRPEVQKSVFLKGLMRCRHNDDFMPCAVDVWDRLYGSTLPQDFGQWSLERAVALAETAPQVAEYLLQLAVQSHRQTDNQLPSRTELFERTRGNEALSRRLAVLMDPPAKTASVEARQEIEEYSEEEERGLELWARRIRSSADDLLQNRAPPGLLFEIGKAYFGYFAGGFTKIEPEQRMRRLLRNDERLFEATLAGLRGTVWREDLPDAEEIIRLRSESRMHFLGFPFLAGMEEIIRVTPARLDGLSERQMRTALAFYYCLPTGRVQESGWYTAWVTSRPHLVADVFIKYAKSAMRSGEESVSHLDALALLDNHAQVASRASLPLLQAFPVRCKLQQLKVLDLLLWSAIQHGDQTLLLELIAEKLSRRSMHVAQRVHWIAAGVMVCPETYLPCLESSVGDRESRVRQLMEFMTVCHPLPLPTAVTHVPTLESLIRLIGRLVGPAFPQGRAARDMLASDQVEQLIQRLACLPGEATGQALDALASDAALRDWRLYLGRARDSQRVIHRDADYCHPSIEQVCSTLRNEAPANVGDLAALVVDRLNEIAVRIRTGNTDDWRQYWNEDSFGRPRVPKHEDSCRDALLSDLRSRLREDVDAQPEGQYANDKRSDIRVACKDFNVPVEVKKSTHREIWRAMRDQLMASYTADPATRGYGVYLVFWFGADRITLPPDGDSPKTATELEERLEETLSEEESRKITVCVIDVSLVGS